jgi:hypothetical protein
MQGQVTVALSTAQTTATAVQRTAIAARLLLVLALFAGIWLALWPFTYTPEVVPADAPAAQFSAERARQNLAVIAAQPHPIGSPRNAEVRDHLVAQIRSLGLEPEIQEAITFESSAAQGMANLITVQNVLARVPGTGDGPAVLISGHYDSAPTTPGAADCGGCVVTVLEALRAILAGPPLQNDVIFLFTDGEEVGVVGAEAFTAQHPWAKDVGLTLVFEGLGTHGASVLYTTGTQNGAMIGETLRAASYPLAYSFMNDLMWTLAGNTGSDLDAFVAAGQPGMAFIHLSLDSAVFYHTLGDNVGNLQMDTLQSHGTYAVDLLRHFGNLDLSSLQRSPDAVYFNVAPRLAVHYPGALALPLASMALLLFAAVTILGLRCRRLSIAGILVGALGLLLGLVLAVVLVTMTWWLIRLFNPALHMMTVGGWYRQSFYMWGFVALSLFVVGGLHFLWRRRFRLGDLAVGALFWWMLLALLTATSLTGFSAVFTWPLLAALLSLGWMFWRPESTQVPWAQVLIWLVPTVVALVLAVPLIYMLAIYAGRMEALVGFPSMALPIPMVVLLLGLLLPVFEFLAPSRRRWMPLGALLASLALLGTATGLSGFDAAHPKTNTVIYWLDANQNQARWITVDDSRSGRGTSAQLDEWTRQFFPNGGQESSVNPWLSGWFTIQFPALEAAAPVADLPSSSLVVLSDETTGTVRRSRLHIAIPDAVQNTHIVVQASAPMAALTVNGSTIDLRRQLVEGMQINVLGRQPDGVTLELAVSAGDPVHVSVQDRILGLPSMPGLSITPRPDWMMPGPWNDSADSSIVQATYELAPIQ